MFLKRCFWKDVWPEEDFLEKATTIKRFEYLPLDSQRTKLTYKKSQKNKTILNKKKGFLFWQKGRPYFDRRYNKYHDIEKNSRTSFTTKKNLKEFKTNFELFYKETIGIKPTNESQKKAKNLQK